MKEYVLTFLFTPDLQKVWLIEKQKPEWQKGNLNGIGGKIDDTDKSPLFAAIREIKEESGLSLNVGDIKYVGNIHSNTDYGDDDYEIDNNFIVYVFAGVTNKELKTVEEENVFKINVSDIRHYNYIDNIPLLLESCLFSLTNKSNFNKIEIIYD